MTILLYASVRNLRSPLKTSAKMHSLPLAPGMRLRRNWVKQGPLRTLWSRSNQRRLHLMKEGHVPDQSTLQNYRLKSVEVGWHIPWLNMPKLNSSCFLERPPVVPLPLECTHLICRNIKCSKHWNALTGLGRCPVQCRCALPKSIRNPVHSSTREYKYSAKQRLAKQQSSIGKIT